MKMLKAKCFWKMGDIPKRVVSIPYNSDEEYYSFLRMQFEVGYRQIIISSEIMIEFIKDAVLNNNFSVYDILLSEDDEEMQNEVTQLLNLIEVKPVCFGTLLEKLSFVAENSSIDIQRISAKGRMPDGQPVDFFVQSNGLFAANETAFATIQKKVSTLIDRCLFA